MGLELAFKLLKCLLETPRGRLLSSMLISLDASPMDWHDRATLPESRQILVKLRKLKVRLRHLHLVNCLLELNLNFLHIMFEFNLLIMGRLL